MAKPPNWYFDWLAPTYDWLALDRDLDAVVEGLDFDGPGALLDLGGGTGKLLEDLENKRRIDPGRSLLVDYSQPMLQQAKSRTRASGVRGDAHELPLRSSLFDGVFMGDTLHHMEDPVAVLTEVNRVLRPGGRAVIEEFNPATILGKCLEWGETLAGMGSRFRPPETLKEEVEKAGLDFVNIIDQGYVYFLVARRPE
jgi:ubiquinone/menaquinone biosynthesis C-methylase UbiE